ncbi:hypothetical protein [Frondihabitans peucedani]|uniref:Uncharacterized protein n=1 Tax=Frondihabitans peucedani TaxID=598626 RepID=A0ABP8E445_9MICO
MRRPGLDTVVTAAVAVGCLIVVRFAVAFVQLLGNAVAYDPSFYSNGFLRSPIGLFLGSLVLYPFPFYLAAFALLALVLPILREASLPTVVRRALLAGTGATVVLMLVGIVTGVSRSVSSGDAVDIALWVVFIPIAAGVQLTAVLVGGAVVAWLWLLRVPVEPGEGAQDATAAPREDAPAPTRAPAPSATPVPAPDPAPAPAPTAGASPAPRPEPPISIYAPPDDRD